MGGRSSSGEAFLEKLTVIIEARITDSRFGVSELAREMGMSRSNLHRKVRSLTGASASRFIRRVRLEQAMLLLNETSLTVSEISWQVGFSSVSYFIKCFHDHYGFSPGDTREHSGNGVVDVQKEKAGTSTREKWLFIITPALILTVILLSIAIVLRHRFDSQASSGGQNTLAILPFRNDSPDSSNAFFVNGLMESILNNLANVEGFSVRSRTSVEKFRDSKLSLPEIASILGVNYIVEGSGQKYGNEVVFNIQLVNAASDRHLFSKQYTREIEGVNDFIDLQREIAYEIASEIESTVGTNDINWYKSIKTRNYVALSNYFEGRELRKPDIRTDREKEMSLDSMALEKFRMAATADSTFAWPVASLGWTYYSFYVNKGDPNFLDSAFYFARKAIAMDSTYTGGYDLLSFLFHKDNKDEKALEAAKLSMKYSKKTNPTLSGVHRQLSSLYYRKGEYVQAVKQALIQQEFELESGEIPQYYTLGALRWPLNLMGFEKESLECSNRILAIDHDSASYIRSVMFSMLVSGQFDSVLKFGDGIRGRHRDLIYLPVAWASFFKRDYENACLYYEKFKAVNPSADIGYCPAYAYLKSGREEKAKLIFNQQIAMWEDIIRSKSYSPDHFPYVRLAAVYVVLGDKAKAIEYLMKNPDHHVLVLTDLRYNPKWDMIREDPAFRKVLHQVGRDYQKEHQQIARLLKTRGTLGKSDIKQDR